MILALGAAIWLNMKYSSGNIVANTSSGTKYLGEALYVDSVSGESVEASASAQSDSFTTAITDREETRKEAKETANARRSIRCKEEAWPDVPRLAVDAAEIGRLGPDKIASDFVRGIEKNGTDMI